MAVRPTQLAGSAAGAIAIADDWDVELVPCRGGERPRAVGVAGGATDTS